MAAQGVKSRDVLDELENHLCEDVANQVHSGTDAAEAFKIAAQRIGQGAVLKKEFTKLNVGKPSLLPAIFRATCFISGPFMLLVGAWAVLDSDGVSFGQGTSLLVISCLAIYTGSLPFWHRSLPSPNTKWLSIALKTATALIASLPLIALLGALGVRCLQTDNTVTMILFCVVAAFCATMFAYACLDLERGTGWGFACPAADRFTDLAQRATEMAHDEAGRLGHDYVGTEHLLLGVISCDSGLLSDLLRKWNIDAETIRAEIEKMVSPGAARKSARDIPYTPRAKRALGLAAQELLAMGHSFVSPEHILLGLLMEKEGVAGLVLRGLGINAERARRDILNGMGPDGDEGARPVLA